MTQSIMITSAFNSISSVKMAYSTNADMSSHSLTGAVTVDSTTQLAIHTITGLADGTRYYYQPATTGGTLFGDKGTFKTNPAAGAGLNMSIILGSCMSNAGAAGAFDASEPAWQKVLDLGPHDLMIHQGDFHYQGLLLQHSTKTSAHILKYGHQLQGFAKMRQAFLDMASIVMRSDHEYSGDDGDSNASGAYGPVVRLMIDAALQMMPVPAGDWGDTRTPKQGLWRTWKPGPSANVLFVVTDFRSLERSLQAMDDGPTKTALGATQLAWLQTQLQRAEPLKIILNDNAWGPAGPLSDFGTIAAHQDKWWCYQFEQAVIANMINNLATVDGKSINVDYWGGDRHALGWLSEDNNILADGTPCAFDVITASGFDKNSLQAAPGELYDEAFGFKPTADQDWEPRQFGHITLVDDPVAKTITRTFDGWNCAPDITIKYTPQTYAPVKVIDGKSKTWGYGDSGGGEGLRMVNPGDQTGTVGDVVSLQLSAAGGTSPYAFTAIRLPAGLSISGTGLITGTLTTAQTKSPTVTVTDADDTTASVTFAWTVAAAPPPALVVNSPGNQSDTVGDAVSVQMTASGGVTPYAWSATSLPPGATIGSSTGKITGTLTTAGDYTPRVTCTDHVGTIAHVDFSWHVAAGTGFTWPAGSVLPDITDPEDLRQHIGGDTHWNFTPGSGGGYQA